MLHLGTANVGSKWSAYSSEGRLWYWWARTPWCKGHWAIWKTTYLWKNCHLISRCLRVWCSPRRASLAKDRCWPVWYHLSMLVPLTHVRLQCQPRTLVWGTRRPSRLSASPLNSPGYHWNSEQCAKIRDKVEASKATPLSTLNNLPASPLDQII